MTRTPLAQRKDTYYTVAEMMAAIEQSGVPDWAFVTVAVDKHEIVFDTGDREWNFPA